MSDDAFDTDRLDDVILALLWANSFKEKFGGYRAWKSLPWDALDRLHAKGLIGSAHGRAHSVTLDDMAIRAARRCSSNGSAPVRPPSPPHEAGPGQQQRLPQACIDSRSPSTV
jgi:hypothetical protein